MYNTEHRKVNILKNKLVKLFFSTLYLSAFTFGGGYVIVSLMRKKFVEDYHWIDEDEMLDLVAIAQSAPGPIAVNGAIVVGYKMAGLLGIFISVLATIIPPFVIISVISVFYEIFKTNLIVSLMLEGMQAGVGAVIASVCFEMGSSLLKEKNSLYPIIMIGAFVANYIFNINVMIVIIVCIMIGLLYSMKGVQS
jgi:chromate transporter